MNHYHLTFIRENNHHNTWAETTGETPEEALQAYVQRSLNTYGKEIADTYEGLKVFVQPIYDPNVVTHAAWGEPTIQRRKTGSDFGSQLGKLFTLKITQPTEFGVEVLSA